MSGFPELRLDASDVSGSFKAWLDEFTLAIALRTLEAGKEKKTVDAEEVEVDKFGEKAKTLVLLRSIGNEGRQVLASAGHTNVHLSTEPMYQTVLDVLETHFGSTESRYVKTQKFVTVRQAAGEEYGRYLLRVEALSRSLDMFKSNDNTANKALQDARQDLALVLAVNGLRDQTLCRELISDSTLTWKKLGDTLRAKAVADESVVKLHANVNSANVKVKVEPSDFSVNAVHDSRVPKRDSRPQRRDSRDSDGTPYRGYRNRERSASRDSTGSGRNDVQYGTRRRNSDRHGRRSPSYSRSGSRDRYSRFYKRSSSPYGRRRSPGGETGCFNCGSRGHTGRDCPTVTCYRCQTVGHIASGCKAARCLRCRGAPHGRRQYCPEAVSRSRSRDKSPGRSVRFCNEVESVRGELDSFDLD